MKVTEKTRFVGHEFQLAGKTLTGSTIGISIAGPFDVVIGDRSVYRDRGDIDAERAAVGLPPSQPKYASKQDLIELADLAIARFKELKDSLK